MMDPSLSFSLSLCLSPSTPSTDSTNPPSTIIQSYSSHCLLSIETVNYLSSLLVLFVHVLSIILSVYAAIYSTVSGVMV